MSTRHQSHTFTWLQQADFTRIKGVCIGGVALDAIEQCTCCLYPCVAIFTCLSINGRAAFHVQAGAAAWLVIFEYWSLFIIQNRSMVSHAQQLSSFVSAHVCSQLTTKARRNRRRSFNFKSCMFMSRYLILHFQVLHFLVLHFQPFHSMLANGGRLHTAMRQLHVTTVLM